MGEGDGLPFDPWREPPRRREALRYAACALVVSAVASLGMELLTKAPAGPAATETPDAVEVDLPPAMTSSLPRSDAPDGPEQQAIAAPPAAPAAPPPKPVEDMPPVPRPPEAPDPDATIAEKQAEPPPLPPPVAAAPAQEEQAQAGAAAHDAAPVEAEAPAKPARTHAIAMWQRAMVEHLEHAKRRVHRGVHVGGTVEVAFRIDREGALVSKTVRRSSGNAVLDHTALDLLAAAAPFPRPPGGLGEAGLSFTVPVRFR